MSPARYSESLAMLSTITVLEVSNGITVAYCGRLLADLGARVITLEPPGGCALRAEGPYADDRPNSTYGGVFAYLQRGKESVTLDLATADGLQLLDRLVCHADILVQEFTGTAVDHARPRYERLRRENPALVMAAISPFGLSGPRRSWQATPLTLFAMSSRMRLEGKPDRHPLQYGPDTVPFQVGAAAAAATVVALVGRQVTGAGRLVEVAALEALIANADVLTVLASFTGVLSGRGLYAPLTYPCRDGYIILSFREQDIAGLMQAMGRPDLSADPRFAGRSAFAAHQDEFDALLLPWLIEHDRQELFETLQAHKVMCAPVFDFNEMLADRHHAARGFFRTVNDPVLGRLTTPGSPFRPPRGPDGCPPLAPGTHNQAFYQEMLGMSALQLTQLRQARVI